MEYAFNTASKIYKYYYGLAIKEFNPEIANKLAKIPADYVYNSLNTNDCYIDERCCLEYCNDMLDSEFNKMDPGFKRSVYNKAFNVQSTVSESQINLGLKAKRRKFKNTFFNEVHNLKSEQVLVRLFENINIGKKRNIDSLLKDLSLN